MAKFNFNQKLVLMVSKIITYLDRIKTKEQTYFINSSLMAKTKTIANTYFNIILIISIMVITIVSTIIVITKPFVIIIFIIS